MITRNRNKRTDFYPALSSLFETPSVCCAVRCALTAALSSAEEAFVIELMLASVRQAAEGPPFSGRGAGKKVRLPVASSIRWRSDLTGLSDISLLCLYSSCSLSYRHIQHFVVLLLVAIYISVYLGDKY